MHSLKASQGDEDGTEGHPATSAGLLPAHESPARAPQETTAPHLAEPDCSAQTCTKLSSVIPGNLFFLLSCSALLAHQLSAVSQQLQGLNLAGSVPLARVQLPSSAEKPCSCSEGLKMAIVPCSPRDTYPYL